VVCDVARYGFILVRMTGRRMCIGLANLGENGVEGSRFINVPASRHTVAARDIWARLMELHIISIYRVGGGEDKWQ
jgi:hypothetical protein